MGSTNGKLTLTSNELGLYSYDLALTATAAGPEKAVYFRAPLGGSHQQSTKFMNFAKLKTEYACKVSKAFKNNMLHRLCTCIHITLIVAITFA